MIKNKNARSFIAFQVLLLVFTLLFPSFLTIPSPLGKCIVKQFVYNLSPDYPPIDGLTVSLYDSVPNYLDQQITNATGHVKFVGLPDGTYELRWMWGGVEDNELKSITSDKMVWEFTNYLEPKSGGGLLLAEARGQASHASRQVIAKNG